MSSNMLCPGYTQVSSFAPDDEYERGEDGAVEEEVSYVTLDLGSVEPTLVPSSSNYRLIGLDSPAPFLQLSGTVFKGRHQKLLGTELLFAEDKDEHDPSKKTIVHFTNTEQRIQFHEVDLKPRPVKATASTPSASTSQVPSNPEQAALPPDIAQGAVAPLVSLDSLTGTPEITHVQDPASDGEATAIESHEPKERGRGRKPRGAGRGRGRGGGRGRRRGRGASTADEHDRALSESENAGQVTIGAPEDVDGAGPAVEMDTGSG
ncbi:uncharacterized protein STEHIDRAFT_125683 [Stereum hirsutum FP-91666 SS1]|uniref:uncharacterized protein n=1 Tax=Stereum hirsutum (strain FP-91666) TaxID=721885 RepID=UPI000444A3A2|nr:uncharacterized protein STEHIDRAFT_125683 [Stereum hirsutum FP-91666 SS1]EIM80643.1 hypothetical protein STEHIDRAFT_125683 [Stereum hirsutum FP-91666 SS1]